MILRIEPSERDDAVPIRRVDQVNDVLANEERALVGRVNVCSVELEGIEQFGIAGSKVPGQGPSGPATTTVVGQPVE